MNNPTKHHIEHKEITKRDVLNFYKDFTLTAFML